MKPREATLSFLPSALLTLATVVAAWTTASADLVSSSSVRGDGYNVVSFTAGSGSWTVPDGVTSVEVLVVGGGGSGAAGSTWTASGGGAGGLYYTNSYAVTPGAPVAISVGGGGAARSSYGVGNDGSDSAFDQIIGYGGKGGGYSTSNSHYGGNQGGHSIDGGSNVTAGYVGGGPSSANGGGGASHVGLTGGYGGNSSGGDGLQYSITGTATYYGGGGGGGYSGAINLGGLGGGGKGATDGEDGRGHNGVNGLGGGGGASRDNGTSGAGGSGIVIVAYPSGVTAYTVTFESNGGSAVTSQTVASGNTATQPANPTKAGHTFAGWYSDIDLTVSFNFATPITGNITLYAKWLVNYVVTFDSNGGSAVASQTVPSGSTATQPANPSKTGHTFVEWCTDPELTAPFDFGTAIVGNVTLYAKWQINNYTLNYSAGVGGSIIGDTPQSVQYGGSGTAVTAQPDPGYRFVKWSDNSTSNPRTDSNVGSDITVSAVFELIVVIEPTSVTSRGGGYTVATFAAGSGVWTVPADVTSLEVLVVGGGGSGAAGSTWTASGGGAGGVYYTSSYAVTPGAMVTIAVGAGGAARSSYGAGNDGDYSVFDQIIAYGGKGGGYSGSNSHYGGNQGGHSIDGGSNVTAGYVGGGPSSANGGGGASHVGLTGGYGGNSSGGDGLSCSITGTATYYGGGGGGGYSGAINLGGLGGGGKGATDGEDGRGHNGVNGLGGGGGASRDNGISGGGGSGVVIVAYLSATPYDTWKTGTFAHDFTDTDPTHDPDNDGLTNQQEFAFGLDPTSGSSNSPVEVATDLTAGTFRYTRWAASGLTYVVRTSDNLVTWSDPAAVTENVSGPDAQGVETVEVTLTSPPSGSPFFVRVEAY